MFDHEEIDWSKKKSSNSPSKGPHRDYESNLLQAREFCRNVQKSLMPGMRVEITGSHGLENSLLMISWMPPRTAKVGNYATPIFLHQARSQVNKEIEAVFNSYMKMVNDFKLRHNLKEEIVEGEKRWTNFK